jgi:hypothetical protein
MLSRSSNSARLRCEEEFTRDELEITNQATMLKGLKIGLKIAFNPAKITLSPKEWGVVTAMLNGSRPRWETIAKWAHRDNPDCPEFVNSLENALKQIQRASHRLSHKGTLFFALPDAANLGLLIQYERRFTIENLLADPAIASDQKDGILAVGLSASIAEGIIETSVAAIVSRIAK